MPFSISCLGKFPSHKMKEEVINTLNTNGSVVVMPTDTIYGILGRAFDKKAVAKIYELKKRTPNKPLIVLIADHSDLEKFGASLSEEDKKVLEKIWPGPFSVELSLESDEFSYINSGHKLAVRLPNDAMLRETIRETGPLVAPSANLEGQRTATTIEEAKKYFGDGVNFYVDNGEILEGEPSTLISLKDGKIEILRQGRGKLDPMLLI